MLIVKGQEVMAENAQDVRTLYDKEWGASLNIKMTSSSFGTLLMRFRAYILHWFLGDFVGWLSKDKKLWPETLQMSTFFACNRGQTLVRATQDQPKSMLDSVRQSKWLHMDVSKWVQMW